MVCETCTYLLSLTVAPQFATRLLICILGQKKLGTVIVPDKWKEGAKNTNECVEKY
jgi:hypothetical protein